MEIEKIFEIGRFLGICKIWTVSPKTFESPFYQTMPTPLSSLKNKLEQLEIQKETIKDIKFCLDELQKIHVISNEMAKFSEEKDSKKYKELYNEARNNLIRYKTI